MTNHTVLIDKDKRRIPVADSAAPLKNQNGTIIGCVIVFRDVTKEYEIDKAKTEFVSLASHQLRTPLSAINWYAEMLNNGDAGKLTKEQEQYVTAIYKGNQRMVELVNALLDVSRIEIGTFMIDPAMTDLVALAKDVVKESTPEINRKKLKISQNYQSGLAKISVDPKLTRMIIQNLLSNSIKYTKKGTISISIKKDDDDVLIEVADSGLGIPKEQQNRVFQKLFRADNVRETDNEGTGLGLYIIKSILFHTGGTIRFESAENKGTKFYVTIPLKGMKKQESDKTLT
jgi:signal transduction histidine kinase